jgi:hypothetical protein
MMSLSTERSTAWAPNRIFAMTKVLDDQGITVSGTSRAYEEEIVRILEKMILNSFTGKAIVTKIKAHGAVLITDDYPGIDRRELNSDFQPSLSSKKLGIIGFHPHNKNLNSVQVVFNGTPWTPSQVSYIHKHSPGMKPDEVLCHEMMHAARWLGGDFKKTPIPSMPEYETEEEYFAILVTNIYSSEKGRGVESFRKSHNLVYKPEMSTVEAAPFVFLGQNDNLRLIAKFCSQHPVIAPMIAQVPAAFNPIRDFLAMTS